MQEPAPIPKSAFESRVAIRGFLVERYPFLADTGGELSPIRGGVSEASRLLGAIDPPRYRRTRNHLDGAVTRLSPYIRHGLVLLSEVRDRALARVGNRRSEARKLVQELTWRDYYQRVLMRQCEAVWQDIEPYKTGLEAEAYGSELPGELREESTGLACIDGFARELHSTGWLHNHARMYVAAYVVHWRRARWQAGARWFLEHLIDGDLASNNLSWQWVASTFGARPYIFNRDNLERATDGRYCEVCPRRHDCPFDGSYEELTVRLFDAEAFA